MKKYSLIAICLLALMLAGCSKSTGVMPWAPGVYSVTADLDKTLFTSHADAERCAYQEAAAFCASKGQQVYVKNFDHITTRWYYTVKLIFSCSPAEEGEQSGYSRLRKINTDML